jgi:protein-disulfide isomerase
MRLVYLLLSVIAAGSAARAAQPAKNSALDKATLEAYLRRVELLTPSVKMVIGDPKPSMFEALYEVPVEVVTQNGIVPLRYFVSKDGKLIVKGNVYDVSKNPFQGELNKLKTDLQPSFGSPGAPVVLVLFSDFECPRCKEEAQAMRANLLKEFPDKVRVYFKDFPLEQMHPWAKPAAIAGRCVYRQQPAAFWDYYDWIYEHQGEILADNLKTKVAGWAESKNVDTQKLIECMDTKATEAEVDREVVEGRNLLISGTPTLFINGRPITGAIPWDTLKEVINRELGYQQTAADAGEKCCEVTIPSLAPKK